MNREIYCVKLQKNLPGLQQAPYPGPLGQRIFTEISQMAWDLWTQQQTMLINENRLNLLDESAQDFLEAKMQAFLFENEDTTPIGFRAE